MKKPVAKSLHTVTVIVQVANLYRGLGSPTDAALHDAMVALGLDGREDPYGLRAQALAKLGA